MGPTGLAGLSAILGHNLRLEGKIGTLVLVIGDCSLGGVQLVIRVGVVALLVQLILLAFGREQALGSLFRAAAVAVIALVLGNLVRIAALLQIGRIAPAPIDLITVPTSLASLALPHATMVTNVYALLNGVNVFEALWVAILLNQLRAIAIERRLAWSAVMGTWLIVAALQFLLVSLAPLMTK